MNRLEALRRLVTAATELTAMYPLARGTTMPKGWHAASGNWSVAAKAFGIVSSLDNAQLVARFAPLLRVVDAAERVIATRLASDNRKGTTICDQEAVNTLVASLALLREQEAE